jgi:hypothetical protein
MIEIKKFNNVLESLNSDQTDIVKLVLEETDDTTPTITNTVEEADPKSLTLDTIVYVSQEQKDGQVKKFEFTICEVWLKPQNVWTILNIKKEKKEGNFWILFYDNGTYYLKKGIKGPIGVHVQLKHKEQN